MAYQILKHSKYVPPKDVTPLSYFPKLRQESLKDLSAMTNSEYQELIETKDSFTNFFGEECLKPTSSQNILWVNYHTKCLGRN